MNELKQEFSKGIILPTDQQQQLKAVQKTQSKMAIIMDKKGFQNDVIQQELSTEKSDQCGGLLCSTSDYEGLLQ